MGLHLIMPMGGAGSRFTENGFSTPKPMIQIHGHPFFYWAAESVRRFTALDSLTFVVLKEHIQGFGIDGAIKAYYPGAKFRVLERTTAGAVLTCLEGVRAVEDDAPVIFNDCDHIFICHDFYRFCAANEFAGVDGALLTFESGDPKFSYLETGKDGLVTRTVEKEAISSHAICGAYYFRNRAVFEQAARVYLKECTYKEFYISGVYNVMARQGARIRSFAADMHLPFGTPEEYDAAIGSGAFGVFA